MQCPKCGQWAAYDDWNRDEIEPPFLYKCPKCKTWFGEQAEIRTMEPE